MPKDEIGMVAQAGRELDATLVNVYGETILEKWLAVENGVYLEVSGRKGHGLATGAWLKWLGRLGRSCWWTRMPTSPRTHCPRSWQTE